MRAALLALFLAACGSSGPQAVDGPSDGGSPCGDACDIAQVCLAADGGFHRCTMICANSLRCWSLCCVSLPGDAGLSVCMPEDVCFGARP